MHKFYYGYLGRDVWAGYCACGWVSRITASKSAAHSYLFVAFIEHLESTVEDDRDDEVL